MEEQLEGKGRTQGAAALPLPPLWRRPCLRRSFHLVEVGAVRVKKKNKKKRGVQIVELVFESSFELFFEILEK